MAPWRSVLAGAAAWGGLVSLDLLADPHAWQQPDGARVLVSGLGLGLGVGSIQGALHAVVSRSIGAGTTRRALVVWGLVGLLGAWWVAHRTAVWAELHGPQRGSAALLLLGLGLGVLVLAVLTSGARPGGARSRRAWLVLVALVAIGATLADRVLYPGEVPAVHVGLRVVAAWMVMLGIDAALARAPRLGRALALATAAAMLLAITAPFVLLDGSQRRVLGIVVDRPFSGLALAVLRDLGDRDRDGHAAWLGGGDCAPDDPAVHPSATEIADNGVDDNCVLGDAHARAADTATVPIPAMASPINVVLVTVDTLAAAHTSLHGHGRPTTPHLDAWAEDAVVFERAYTSGGWTAIAIPSLFRGLYPRRLPWAQLHRGSVDEPPRLPRAGDAPPFAVFPVVTDDAPPPLAWWLSRRGMATAAVVDDGATMVLSGELRTDLGFGRFESMRRMPDASVGDGDTVARAAAVLAELAAGPPFFLWVHLYGPHAPNETHAGVPEFGPGEADAYDHEIAATDRALADLLAATDALDGRPTLVVVTADHGEDIENGQRFHGTNCHESVIHVPLVMKMPGLQGRRDTRVVSLVDVMPTILAATDTPAPRGLDGVDLLTQGAEGSALRIVLTDTWRIGADGMRTTDIVAALDGTFKVQLLLGPRAWAAFDQREPQARAIDRWGEAQLQDLEHAVLDYLEHAPRPATP